MKYGKSYFRQVDFFLDLFAEINFSIVSFILTPRSNASAIYIPSQNKMFVFGGLTQFGNTNDLWSLDLTANSWALVPTNFIQLPSARVTHVCMYDSLLNRMLLWSGQGSTLYNDVWAFNFVNEKNKQFSFLKCSPNPSNGNTRLSFNVSEK